MSVYAYSFISVLSVSVVSLIGVIAFAVNDHTIRKHLTILVSFSTGGLFGDVFLHMIPEMSEEAALFQSKLILLLVGILLSFFVEKIIHWRHCHCRALPDTEEEDHIHPLGLMNLFGDGVHNFIDGALIAGSFLVSFEIGIATTIAVVLHEIPQEIGDFAILLFSGYSRSRALTLNFLSAVVAFIGAGIVLVFASSLPLIGDYLLPIAAGNFLYIAGADLIPELHKESRLPQTAVQLIAMFAGLAVMFVLTFLE